MSKHIKKWCRNEAKIHEKSAPEVNKKRCLKTDANKSQKSKKIISTWTPKSEYILGEMPLGAPLVVQTAFVMKKLAPSAPKVRPRTKHEPKMTPKGSRL